MVSAQRAALRATSSMQRENASAQAVEGKDTGTCHTRHSVHVVGTHVRKCDSACDWIMRESSRAGGEDAGPRLLRARHDRLRQALRRVQCTASPFPLRLGSLIMLRHRSTCARDVTFRHRLCLATSIHSRFSRSSWRRSARRGLHTLPRGWGSCTVPRRVAHTRGCTPRVSE